MKRLLIFLLCSTWMIGQSKISDNQIRTPPPLQCNDTSSSGTTQTCTTSPSFTPAAKDCVVYNTTTTNTGALTLNVNSQGAKAVQKWLGTAVVAGDVVLNKPQLACYDGTNWLLSTIGNAPGGSSGALVQLETHTASTSATLDFTTCFSSSYHQYLIIAKNLLPATNSVQALLRFSTNGGSTYDATTGIYDSNALVFDVGGVSTEVAVDTNNQSIQLGWQSLPNTAANGGVSYKFTIYDPLNGANAKVNLDGDQQYWGTKTEAGIFGASYHSSAAANAFRILFSSGNITSGVVTCYGITP